MSDDHTTIMRLEEQLKSAIEYTEAVDAMLDGTVPSRVDPKDPTSQPLWLKERLQRLLDEHERQADMLSDCWLFLDALARLQNGGCVQMIAVESEKMLRKHKVPGWRDREVKQ